MRIPSLLLLTASRLYRCRITFCPSFEASVLWLIAREITSIKRNCQYFKTSLNSGNRLHVIKTRETKGRKSMRTNQLEDDTFNVQCSIHTKESYPAKVRIEQKVKKGGYGAESKIQLSFTQTNTATFKNHCAQRARQHLRDSHFRAGHW